MKKTKDGNYTETRKALKRHFETSLDLSYALKHLMAMIYAVLDDVEIERRKGNEVDSTFQG